MKNLAYHNAGQAEVVGVLARVGGLARRIDHGGGLANDGEVTHSSRVIPNSIVTRLHLSFRAKRGICFLPVEQHYFAAAIPCFSAVIAARIASYIWLYPVQRHRLLLRAARTSASDGSGFSASSDFTVITKPGVQ